MTIESLERMLASGKDGTLLRFGLGSALLKEARWADAAQHLRACVMLDPTYAAAWKLLGKALAEAGDVAGAREAYTQALSHAQTRGDKQIEREVAVFLRRLDKAREASA